VGVEITNGSLKVTTFGQIAVTLPINGEKIAIIMITP
jgi:hypothetical protein